MKKSFLTMAIFFIMCTPALAYNVEVEALSDFSTDNPPKTFSEATTAFLPSSKSTVYFFIFSTALSIIPFLSSYFFSDFRNSSTRLSVSLTYSLLRNVQVSRNSSLCYPKGFY